MNPDLHFQIALSLIPKVGPVLARKLVAYTGSVEGVFREKKANLLKVPGIGDYIVKGIDFKTILLKAEKELNYIERNSIKTLFYLEEEYPNRLKECEDAPLTLFYKGQNCFNAEKVISIVGTRQSTSYGEEVCRKLVENLAVLFPDLLVVSGFAYGIDICAHKAALENNLKTVGVFGHGVQYVYPSVHSKYVNRVLEEGALVSEFPSKEKPDPGNFVSRNRIIAGLADASIVIESGEKGGSLLTADMALSYDREVFAFPGRSGDKFSKGCNNLIKRNAAALIESASDLVYYMDWSASGKQQNIQKSLFLNLTPEEEKVVGLLKQTSPDTIDQMARKLKQPVSKLSALLLKLEFDGVVESLPGKNYKLR